MLRTIEARYDHGNFILMEKFPQVDTASLLITILDNKITSVTKSETGKTALFLGSLKSAAGVWKNKKMDVDKYIRDMRQDREL